MKEIQINILTPKTLMSKEEGEQVLRLICDIYPAIAPDRYGRHEPLRNIFDASCPQEAINSWDRTFLWKRRKPKVEGGVLMAGGAKPKHGWITVSVDAKSVDVNAITMFTQVAARELEADFAAIHRLTPEDILTGRASGTVGCLNPARNRYALSITTFDLIKYIPDLYWGTVFGPAYAELFGLDCLLSSPAPVVTQIDENSVYLQLSETIEDLDNHFDQVDETRRNVKQHLAPDAFFDIHLPPKHSYAVPKFQLDAENL